MANKVSDHSSSRTIKLPQIPQDKKKALDGTNQPISSNSAGDPEKGLKSTVVDGRIYEIHDDERFVQDLLLKEHMLVVQDSSFNYPTPDHFRIVTLPEKVDLTEAIGRLGNFLSTYHQ